MGKILKSVNEIADRDQREVVIPGDYAKIGDGAFRYCALLEKVVIPPSVNEIGEGAFVGYHLGQVAGCIGCGRSEKSHLLPLYRAFSAWS